LVFHAACVCCFASAALLPEAGKLHSFNLVLKTAVVRVDSSTVKDNEVNSVVELADGSSIGEICCVWWQLVQGILSGILKGNGIQDTDSKP